MATNAAAAIVPMQNAESKLKHTTCAKSTFFLPYHKSLADVKHFFGAHFWRTLVTIGIWITQDALIMPIRVLKELFRLKYVYACIHAVFKGK